MILQLPRSATPTIRFTRSAGTGTSPLITAATAADEDFWWQGPGGTFVGKQPNISNFPAGDFMLRSNKWDAVTGINFGGRLLANSLPAMINPVSLRVTAMADMFWNINQLTGMISEVKFPTGLTRIALTINQLTGPISDATFPAGLTMLHLNSNQLTYPAAGGSLAVLTENNADYRFQDNAMIAAHVDNILTDCVASATTGSTLNVSGTNAAPTGGALNADYVTLGTRGWTVTIS